MIITDLKTFVVGTPAPHFGGRYWIFVKLVTNTNIEGIGEVYSIPFHPDVVIKMIEDVFERHFRGNDPSSIEKMWRRVYSSGFTQRPDVSISGILSGLEIACWDILGKDANRPVYQLLGGKVHERLRSYTYLYPKSDDKADVYIDADLAAERALDYADLGFTAVKFDPVGPYSAFDSRQLSLEAIDRSETFCRRIRDSVGHRVDLLFGTHGQMTPASAIRLARRLEKFEPLWLEEPTPPEMPEEMALVARATSIPVATGERLATKYEFARVLQNQSAAILQMALGRVGGLLEAKKIAGMAEAHYVQIAPHLYCGPVEAAANIQLGVCSPNFLIQESIETFGGFHSDIIKNPIQWEDGFIIPPTEPGIGVELDEEVALANPYKGGMLHLEMRPDPVV
ncbi:MAG: mandelate racemase/muconate lactonizing enzyme family protein [Halieaceae bacterium]|nr:mandelate racemase/muconate lactonizing enzyme family protein [Halieaceae bacterium]